MQSFPRAVLLVDNDPHVIATARDALARRGERRPLMILSQHAEARQYLQDSARVNRQPAVMIVRVHPQPDDAGAALLRWLHAQLDTCAGLQVMVIGDTPAASPSAWPGTVTLLDASAPDSMAAALGRLLMSLDIQRA